MPCLVAVFALLAPRAVIVGIFLFTDWFSRAFETALWPILGCIFMPYTTLAWTAGFLHGGVRGGWAILVLIAVLVDLGHLFGGGRHYRVYRERRRGTR